MAVSEKKKCFVEAVNNRTLIPKIILFDDGHLILESNSSNVALSGAHQLLYFLTLSGFSTSKANQIQSTAVYVGQPYLM